MIVNTLAWVAANWKPAMVAGSLALSGVGGFYWHVEDVDTRFDEIEQGDLIRQGQLDKIEEDVSDLKCMAIEDVQNGDPLECLKYK